MGVTTFEFVMQVMTFFSDEELIGILHWRTDGEHAPITFWTNSSDLLAWGCADCEEINEATFPILKQAVEDCKAIDPVLGGIMGCELFACRVNKMRPQGAAYPKNRELWPLFDACGPERETGIGNPYRPGEYKPAKIEQ
jgi:hypothetical protein